MALPICKKGKQNVKLVLRCSAAFSKWATILLCIGVLVQWFWNTKMRKQNENNKGAHRQGQQLRKDKLKPVS